MNRFKYLVRYLRHILTSRHSFGFGIHSPAIYRFVKYVLYEKNSFYVYSEIEKLRRELENEELKFHLTDFGTGVDRVTTIGKVARRSLNNSKYSQLLYRMVRDAGPDTILELGTSLGISTAYMAKARPSAQCYTFEGCPQLAKIAAENFDKLSINNIEIIQDNIDNGLALFLENVPALDFVFVDANHTSKALSHYFELILPKISEKSVVVIDDINWSNDMWRGWEQIKNHPRVVSSLDIFGFGILFFNTEQNKMHYKLIF
ncbi:MAG: class I SAM-dependent methyltransferase [Paludibacter sp.]|nr:class I SAM-dependent methyltransferase [Paludibacter sp.]